MLHQSGIQCKALEKVQKFSLRMNFFCVFFFFWFCFVLFCFLLFVCLGHYTCYIASRGQMQRVVQYKHEYSKHPLIGIPEMRQPLYSMFSSCSALQVGCPMPDAKSKRLHFSPICISSLNAVGLCEICLLYRYYYGYQYNYPH